MSTDVSTPRWAPEPEVPRPRAPRDRPDATALHLAVEYPNSECAVVRLAGALDAFTAPRFEELMRARIRSEVPTVVVDLRNLDFLSVTGLRAMVELANLASVSTFLRVVTGGTRCVERALSATGLSDAFAYGSTVPAALQRS